MPVCPECSFWTPDFHKGDVDHHGTYDLIFKCIDLFSDGFVTVVGGLGKRSAKRNGSQREGFSRRIGRFGTPTRPNQ